MTNVAELEEADYSFPLFHFPLSACFSLSLFSCGWPTDAPDFPGVSHFLAQRLSDFRVSDWPRKRVLLFAKLFVLLGPRNPAAAQEFRTTAYVTRRRRKDRAMTWTLNSARGSSRLLEGVVKLVFRNRPGASRPAYLIHNIV